MNKNPAKEPPKPDGVKGSGGTGRGYATIYPGDPMFTDVICFQRPVAPATELRLVLPALISNDEGTYRFRIPSSAWK